MAVMLGFPFLAGVIGTFFSALVAWFAQFITRKIAVVIAVVAVIVVITGAFFVAIQGIISGISYAVPIEISRAAVIFLPSNFTACMTAAFTVKTLRWAYDWNVKIIQMKLL